MALVLVLSFLVIISGLMIAFFTSVTTERSGSSAAAASVSANALADSAVNVVMAQIVDATQGRSGAGNPSSTQAWASQPGMIRTYANNGTPRNVYKLFSDAKMIDSASSLNAGVRLDNWKSDDMVDVYTDLNAPAADAQGRLNYPILDPTAQGVVEGFKISQAPGYNASEPDSAANNPAPMPVRWLYVLEDGTLVPAPDAPAAGGGLVIAGASEKNRITGRVAFWTDDESSKVNINTASEGVYWDIPRIFSTEDVGVFGSGLTAAQPGLALTQPANNEYQRYPGHPATTSLSAVLGNFLKVPNTAAAINKGQVPLFNEYYNLAPRIAPGGSAAGTQIPTGKLTPDSDRLYASIDELMFKAEASPNGSAAPRRIANTSNTAKPGVLTRDALEKAKFFLTASSNAPEVTLYNTPRVGIWPVHVDPKKRTAYDQVAAFCARVGRYDYFFTRSNARSSTADYDNIARNQTLYQSLQKLTETPVPGFGGNFLTKYQADRDQILTSIFDYIRTTNLSDTSLGATPYTPVSTFTKTAPGGGEVIPIRIGNTQGFGRFDTIAEAGLLFHGVTGQSGERAKTMRAVLLMEFASPMQGNVGYQPNLKHRVTGLDKIEIKLAEDPAAKSANLPAKGENFIEVPGMQTWHGRGIGGTEGMNIAFANKHFDQSPTKRLAISGGGTRGNYPFFSSRDIDIATAKTDVFELCPNGPVQVTVEIVTADTNQVVQTITLEFPGNARLRIPRVDSANSTFNNRLGGNLAGNDWNRLVRDADTVVTLEPAGKQGNDPEPSLPSKPDHTAGDIRMIAALREVPAKYYRAHNDYMTNEKAMNGKSYGMMSALGLRYPNATTGKLVPVTSYMGGGDRQPDVPSRVGEYVARADGGPGDWDTGVAAHKDGAYINKPDEGDQQFVNYMGGGRRIPYMVKEDYFDGEGKTYFSPNRQIPSALMFGSIPTGVQRFLPWQTLLFHPAPEDKTHPSKLMSPPDHLLADLFWMPVVEPYAISQPFSTAGKINMNYQIQPFTYIRRDAGLRAVMKSTKFMALQLGDAKDYKPHIGSDTQSATVRNARVTIDVSETLKAFEKKFDNNELFKSATEICEINLIPPGQTEEKMAAFWGSGTQSNNDKSRRLTGDNLREKPYADIYPRLTTKSNTYTVHVRVQSLKKAAGTPHDQWVNGRDQVLAEYRGASTIERYIDINDPKLPDFAKLIVDDPRSDQLNIDQYYRFRVVNTTRFAP